MKQYSTLFKLLTIALLAAVTFLSAVQYRQPPVSRNVALPEGQVVIPAPLQVLMYAGDRFLAADLEAIRLATTSASDELSLADYRIRAHRLVAQLNPCHEDNYYLANAMLSWGGAVDEGNAILQSATNCRYWDEFPPFFLGFNRYFFFRELEGARQAIEIAAGRSQKNKVTLQKISIVMASKKLNDEKMAAAYLRSQRDEASDKILAEMLDRRLQRLEGLIILREAQIRFEKEQGRPLDNPNELISKGILKIFPQDPMRIGYEFVDGRFQLRAMKISGVEIR